MTILSTTRKYEVQYKERYNVKTQPNNKLTGAYIIWTMNNKTHAYIQTEMTVGAYHAFSQPIYTHNGPTYKQLLQFQFGKPAMASGMAKKTLN